MRADRPRLRSWLASARTRDMNLSVQRSGTVDAGLEASCDTRAQSAGPTLPPLVLALQRLGMPTLRIAALLFPIAFMIVGFRDGQDLR